MLMSISAPKRIRKTANGAAFDEEFKYARIEEVFKV